jgi:methyltransferase (TIGR00027 family)
MAHSRETISAKDLQMTAPDQTAIRTALWRALHVQIDPPPHVLEDEIGLKIVAPDEGWQRRGDMHPQGTQAYRASIVARARFVEDLVVEEMGRGVGQYVLLGAGLDTFAQRRPDLAGRLSIFEIDRPSPQAWKRQRLIELGLGVPENLRLVPVDFEAGESWVQKLAAAGFEAGKPAVVASTGVSMYLTREANFATMCQIAAFAPGTTFVMSFIGPLELIDPAERPGVEAAMRGARAGGNPWLSFFTPDQAMALAREAGFKNARHVSATQSERTLLPGQDGWSQDHELGRADCRDDLMVRASDDGWRALRTTDRGFRYSRDTVTRAIRAGSR